MKNSDFRLTDKVFQLTLMHRLGLFDVNDKMHDSRLAFAQTFRHALQFTLCFFARHLRLAGRILIEEKIQRIHSEMVAERKRLCFQRIDIGQKLLQLMQLEQLLADQK